MSGEVERAAAEALYDALDGDFLVGASRSEDGADVAMSDARPSEVVWWAVKALAAANLLAGPAAEVGLRAAVEALASEWERGGLFGHPALPRVHRRHAAELRAALADHAPQVGEVRGGQEGGA